MVISVVFLNIGFISYFNQYAFVDWAETAVLSLSLGLLALCSGGACGVLLFQVPSIWPRLSQRPLRIDLPHAVAVRTGIVVFATVLLYFYCLGYVPLWEGIKTLFSQGFSRGLVNTLRVQRDIYVNEDATYVPLGGFLESVRYFGLPIVAVWFLHFCRLRIHFRTSLVMLIGSILLIVATGQRWPLMYLFATLIFYWSWTERNSRRFIAAMRRLMVSALACGVLLSVLLGREAYSDFSAGEMIFFGFSDLYARVFFGNVEIPFLSYELFPDYEGWLLGASWTQNLIAFLPGPAPSFPVTFYRLVTGDQIGFTAPPDFFTEAYINFGLPGVIVISFLWGMFLVWFQRLVVMKAGSLLTASMLALMSTLLAFSAISGTMFVVGGMIVCIFILLIVFTQTVLSKSSWQKNLQTINPSPGNIARRAALRSCKR